MTDGTGISAVDAALVWCAALTLLGGGAGMAWRLLRPVWRVARRLDEFADDWNGTPGRAGVPARPGVMARLDRIEHHTGMVAHEVQTNGGQSLRDVVDRVDRRTQRISPDDHHGG